MQAAGLGLVLAASLLLLAAGPRAEEGAEFSEELGPVVASYAAVPIDSLPIHDPDGSAVLPAVSSPPPHLIVTKGRLARGQSLSHSMRSQGIPPSVVHLVSREMRGHFDFRRAQPGDVYRLSQDAEGNVLEFRYRDRKDSTLHLTLSDAGYDVSREPIQLEARVASISGVIETSLYRAIKEQGENPLLAGDFADIFAWDLDFTRSVRPGDDFQILYERLYHVDDDGNEIYVRFGRILAAQYSGAAGEFSAVYFEEDDETMGGFFRPDGTAVEKQFLVAPLKYSRISSNYSAARRHPILKVTRPHHGIDYAAPEGTQVWSVADGTVIYRGWAGGFGNLVKVRHTNGYVSYYAHLSRFVKDLRVGQSVKQKETIGFVGHTGLATGSHVCFRIAKNGAYVNPANIKGPKPQPIAGEDWERFAQVRDQLLARLQMSHAQVVDEAL